MGFYRNPRPWANSLSRKLNFFGYCIDHPFKNVEACVFKCLRCIHGYNCGVATGVKYAKVRSKVGVICGDQRSSGLARTIEVLCNIEVVESVWRAVKVICSIRAIYSMSNCLT